MTAQRAVVLTLLGVVLVAALGVGGFFTYRGYDRYEGALDRARAAEAVATKADARAADAKRHAEGRALIADSTGYIRGLKDALVDAGLTTPGWYTVNVTTGKSPGVQPADLLTARFAPCKSYWTDPRGSLWIGNGTTLKAAQTAWLTRF
jgi:hypothetical protein